MENKPFQFEGQQITPVMINANETVLATVKKEIRSWGITLLVLGVIHLLTSGFLSGSWGVYIIIVGLLSFVFRSASMMVVFAATLLWAAINNAFSGDIKWIGFAILQAVLVVNVFRKYLLFRKAEQDPENGNPQDIGLTPARSAKVFPWVGFGVGLFSFIGLVGMLGSVFLLAVMGYADRIPVAVGYVESALVSLGILGLSFGLAGILSKYQRKAFSIMGVVFGGLTLVIEIAIPLILG